MAFSMYADDLSEYIDHHEEFLFEIASRERGIYPELVKMYSEFYDSPTLDSERAGRLVHELIDLLERHGKSDKNLVRVIFRLLPFFSKASRGAYSIRCSSD